MGTGNEEIADLNFRDELVIKVLGYFPNKKIKDLGLTAKLKGGQNLREAHLSWSPMDDDEDMALHDDFVMVLEGLQPQRNLEVLRIHGFSGSKLPQGSLSSYLPNLVELHVVNCERCVQLPALGMLPRLKVLIISGMTSVKCLGTEFYYQQESRGEGEQETGTVKQATTTTSSSSSSEISLFPSLTKLSLTDMPILEEWLAPPPPYCDNSFPSLKSLIVTGCVGLKSIPLSSCSSLESLELHNTNDEAVNSILDSRGRKGLTSLTSVTIKDSPQLIFFPVVLIQNDTRIQSLEIADCPEFQGFRILNDDMDDKAALGSVFNYSSISSLCSVKLSNCPALTSLPDLREWTSLRELRIENCDKLKKSLPYELASVQSLRALYVDRFVDVSNKLGSADTTYRSIRLVMMYFVACGLTGGSLYLRWTVRGDTPYHWDSVACEFLACALIGLLLYLLYEDGNVKFSFD